MMRKEQENKAEEDNEKFKQSVFAHAFSAVDQRHALKQYYEVFEKPNEPEEFDYELYEPQNEQDVQQMLADARRLGVIA